MTTFNTTACKVKVNGQWTPLLALGGGGGGGGLMVHFSGSGSSVTCDHTVAEIVAAAASGPVSGELDDNVFVLTQYGSSYATFIYSADFDYGGEDYYILSSNYGSNTWTLTEKFKADIYDIQDEGGNSLIGNDHIAVIPSGGGDGDVEWAIKDTTTVSTIDSWLADGKVVMLKDSYKYYRLIEDNGTDSPKYFARVNGSGDLSHMDVSLEMYRVQSPNTYTKYTRNLESSSNKLLSTATWTSSDSKYPSTAAVEQYVAGQSDIEWATYDTTTNAQVYAWAQAGKHVLCNYNSHVYCLTNSSATSAVFVYTGAWASGSSNPPTLYIMRLTNDVWSTGSRMLESSTRMIVSTDTWNSSDSYYHSTAAADGRFQRLSNAMKSTSTWTSNDVSYPTTAAVENYVTAHAGSDVEWATYGTTTISTIKGWFDNGKTVLCNYSSRTYLLEYCTSSVAQFNCLYYANGFTGYNLRIQNGTWYNTSYDLQIKSNMLTSTETWSSTDSYYPSAKAVENYVAGHAGGGDTFWAEYGVTTFSTLEAIYDDYENPKDVKMWYGPYLMQMSVVNSNEISFTSMDYTGGKYYVRHANVTSSNSWSYDYDELNVI